MRSILLQLPELIEDQEIEELLRVGDRNGDGKLDLEDLGYDSSMFYFVNIAYRIMLGYRDLDVPPAN